MPLFFLHLRDGVDELLDPDGVHISADAVPGFAPRGIVAHRVLIPHRCRGMVSQPFGSELQAGMFCCV